MKQNDIILIIVSVFVSGVLSLVLSNLLIGPTSRNTKVEVVEKITPEFIQPDERYFNSNSFNYTQEIQIGSGTNQVQFDQ